MEESFGKAFLNNLTHIVSGILELLVLDSWGDCAHTDTDKSLSMMQSLSVKTFLCQCVKYNAPFTSSPVAAY